MTQRRASQLHGLMAAISALGLACVAHKPSASAPPSEAVVLIETSLEDTGSASGARSSSSGPQEAGPVVQQESDDQTKDEAIDPAQDRTIDQALFDDLIENHWLEIFPEQDRNVGGPMFFKYIYEQLATNHDLFERYNRLYCGVSGAVVRPSLEERYDVVKIKDNDGRCVVGKYYRCCWPCSCDLMKHARVEQATFRLPNDPSGEKKTYWVLTIGDPCYQCDSSPCNDLPSEVTTYKCENKVTTNGLRVSKGELTNGPGRLVFALLHEAVPADQTDEDLSAELLELCTPRFNATPGELDEMGGMGNIFVKLALINSGETLTNTLDDLCD